MVCVQHHQLAASDFPIVSSECPVHPVGGWEAVHGRTAPPPFPPLHGPPKKSRDLSPFLVGPTPRPNTGVPCRSVNAARGADVATAGTTVPQPVKASGIGRLTDFTVHADVDSTNTWEPPSAGRRSELDLLKQKSIQLRLTTLVYSRPPSCR